MNWKLTLTKGVIVGVLAMLAVWLGDVQGVQEWWAGLACVVIETVRDLIKTRFGGYLPDAAG